MGIFLLMERLINLIKPYKDLSNFQSILYDLQENDKDSPFDLSGHRLSTIVLCRKITEIQLSMFSYLDLLPGEYFLSFCCCTV